MPPSQCARKESTSAIFGGTRRKPARSCRCRRRPARRSVRTSCAARAGAAVAWWPVRDGRVSGRQASASALLLCRTHVQQTPPPRRNGRRRRLLQLAAAGAHGERAPQRAVCSRASKRSQCMRRARDAHVGTTRLSAGATQAAAHSSATAAQKARSSAASAGAASAAALRMMRWRWWHSVCARRASRAARASAHAQSAGAAE